MIKLDGRNIVKFFSTIFVISAQKTTRAKKKGKKRNLGWSLPPTVAVV